MRKRKQIRLKEMTKYDEKIQSEMREEVRQV